jgi:hypothetical protein
VTLTSFSKALACAWVLAAASAANSAQAPSPAFIKSIAENHYGVADALQLDAAKFDELIALLAGQLMEQSDHVRKQFSEGGRARDPSERMRNEAEHVTRQVNELRKLLGQEKLERYLELRFSLGQRRQMRELDERLGASDRLNSTQRERLVQLMQESVDSAIDRPPNSSMFASFPSAEDLQLNSQLQTITLNEQIWREMPDSNRKLRERAAEFLTERQLAVLEQMHVEQAATLQRRIEQMRVNEGLSPTIPAQAEVIEVPTPTVERDIKLSLKAEVNDENPRYLTTVASSGKPVSLKVADGLYIEATPIVFEDDTYNLLVRYFETGVTGKRFIGKMGQSGQVMPATGEGRSRNVGGGGGTILTGSKGYAVELSALVEAT